MMCSHKFYGGFRGPKSPDPENSVAVRMGIVCELHSKQRRAHCTLWRRVSFSCRSLQHLFFMRRQQELDHVSIGLVHWRLEHRKKVSFDFPMRCYQFKSFFSGLVQIEYLEFERHGAAGTSSISSHYFDLLIRLKSEQEHQFRNIQRNEYHNLFNFIRFPYPFLAPSPTMSTIICLLL